MIKLLKIIIRLPKIFLLSILFCGCVFVSRDECDDLVLKEMCDNLTNLLKGK